MITTNTKTVILGVIILIIGTMLAVGIVEDLVEKFRKNKREKYPKKKIREMCLRAGELVMLDGLILLMKGLFVNLGNHVLALAVLSWFIVAYFDIFYVSVTALKKKKISEDKLREIIVERNNRLARKANKMGKRMEEEE